MSLLVRGGLIFLGDKFERKDILISDDGKIEKITGMREGADEVVNATNMLVLPGLIDPHVHLREPGDTYKEDFKTGSRAAIAGGFTTVIDMPNNKEPTITKTRLDEKIQLAKKKAVCDILFHFGGTDDNFTEVKKANPQSLKLYLGKTTGNLLLRKPDSIEKHFANFPSERPIVLHACDHSELEKVNLDKTFDCVKNAIAIAEKTNHRVHLAHASTKKEIEIAKKYKNATVEVAPHHLFLSTKDLERLGPFGSVYPPLKSEQKRIGLWSALDIVDCIATDHAPHTIEDKDEGAAGFPGLETSLALMLEGCNRGLIDKIWVAQCMSENVAKAFNIKDKGKLAPGFWGDVTLVDLGKEWTVSGSEMESKCKWSPFDGKKLKGKVHTVIRKGEPVYVEEQFI
ncbi:dihydroorotase family protein [Candidatus Micrarchaeota archaeon]|nr:dihydroorotase family protein [Candidatus Micrarchaeota archaeon]